MPPYRTAARGSRAEARTIRNSNENRPLNLPVSRSTFYTSLVVISDRSVNVPLVTPYEPLFNELISMA